VVLLAALSFVAGLGRGAIADNDEAFYAESAREMVESGNWVTPHFNYEPRFQKPALYYWLTAAVFTITGPTEFSARLFAALAGVGLVLVTTACGRRWYDESVGLLAGAIAATSFGYFALARMSLPDLPLAFFVTAAIWTVFVATLERERNPRKWLLYAATAAALGFLVKGPLALALPALVVVPILLMERRSYNVQFADIVLAALLFLLIALPWYVVMWTQHGTEYLVGFFVGDNFERFATDRFNEPRPWWFYLPIAAGGLLPWTPLMLAWVSPVVQFVTRRRDIGTVDLRLLLWAVIPLIFFTLSIGKQPRYILPVLPPLAILLASSVIERTSEWRSLDGARRRPRPNGAVVTGCLLAGVFLIALAGLVYRARPLFLNVGELNSIVVSSIVAVCGIAVVIVSLTGAWRSAPGLLAFAAAVSFAVLPYGVLSSANDSTVKQMADRVRQAHGGGDVAVGTYKVFVRNLVFYSRVKHTDIIHDDHLSEWLTEHPRALVVMSAADAERLAASGMAMERLSEFRYFNEGGIKVRMLLWPDPATDLETIVLVRIDRSRPTASRDSGSHAGRTPV
jgi:4-amino-4-deoxy-L-arabinose transferase-like glycosyltransferase